MTNQEFFEKFIDYCESTSMIGERNHNGADSYNCPSCWASIDIQGYCCFSTGINDIKHDDDCELYAMYLHAKTKLDQE